MDGLVTTPPNADLGDITEEQGLEAIRVSIELAEAAEQWDLLAALLRYVADSNAVVIHRFGPSDYMLLQPKGA